MHWKAYARDGIPEYLARHYWWAYLSRNGVRVFDHQPIVSAILFGNYKKLLNATLRLLRGDRIGRTLQLTCAYGSLTPRLAEHVRPEELHVVDVAPIQLDITRRKVANESEDSARLTSFVRMNAESLAYADDSFDTVIIFFLLHELPPEVRQRALAEVVRVLRPGGRLLIAEYGALTGRHLFHKLPLFRWIFGTAEPFLPAFQREDLSASLRERCRTCGKRIVDTLEELKFGAFYRVVQYRLSAASQQVLEAAE